jgi:uncharacterized protein
LLHEITDTLHVDFENLDANDFRIEHPMIKAVETIDAKVDIQRSAIGILADFRVTYRAVFSCVRCLESFVTTCQTSLVLNYVSGSDPHAATENIDLTRTDVDKVYYSGSSIDLRTGIREAVLLSLPIAPLCKENCSGLCLKCGVNKNITPCNCVIEEPGLFTPPADSGKSVKKSMKKKNRKAVQ